jgi:pantoate--beta-alanine ligase
MPAPPSGPILHRSPTAMQSMADDWRSSGVHITFVPTMGALHVGHTTLMKHARSEGGVLVASIFVNPTQFGKGEDFGKYPRMLERDMEMAREAGVDVVFAPDAADMYPAGYSTFVDVEGITSVLEGASRPGHFRGVATVVAKLLNIVKPHAAYFGQKDAQQVAVISRMVSDLNIDCRLVIVPTVRESDGLAMSSRNAYLTPEQRSEAPVVYRALQAAERAVKAGKADADHVRGDVLQYITASSSGAIDYVSVANAETLEEIHGPVVGVPVLISLAVRFGTTRLIDNVLIPLQRV